MASKSGANKGTIFQVGRIYSRVEQGTTYICLCEAKAAPKSKSRKARAILSHFHNGRIEVTDGDLGWSEVEDTLDV